MGVICQIFINKARDGVFYSGQIVTGIVKYVLDKPAEYRAITLSLLGTGRCKWTQSDGDGESDYYHGTEDYVTTTINLLQTRYLVKLQEGLYQYPFQFRLPENIPSSFKSKKCTIKYRIQMKFEKTNLFSFCKKFKVEIPVYGLVRSPPEPVQFVMQKGLFKLFSSKEHNINLRGEMPKSCVSPGDNIQMILRVKNNTDSLPKVSVDLIRCKKLTDNNKKSLKSRHPVKNSYTIMGEIAKRSEVNISIRVPTRPELYTIQSKILNIEYLLKVVIVMPGLHSNSVLKIPVVIGERRGFERVVLENVPTWQLMLEDNEKGS